MGENIIEELESSKLGTQDYWDTVYEEELRSFNDHGDVGMIWFGEDAQLRVIEWLLKCKEIHKSDEIIDIGCGNGMALIELAREGFTNLTGVDYSHNAIELARRISANEFPQIIYEVWDMNVEDQAKIGKYKVAHDKGTYDAVSLNPDDPKSKRLQYISNVAKLLSRHGLLIISSCNWTEDELAAQFEECFILVDVIPTVKYTFGGKVGSIVSNIVLKKK